MTAYSEVVEILTVVVTAGLGMKVTAPRVQVAPGALVMQVTVTGAAKPAMGLVSELSGDGVARDDAA